MEGDAEAGGDFPGGQTGQCHIEEGLGFKTVTFILTSHSFS